MGREISTMAYVQATIALLAMVALWIAMAELLQGLETHFARPWMTSWLVHVGYLWFALPWSLMLWWRSTYVPGVSLRSPGYPVQWRQVPMLALWMSWLLTATAYAWYLSLPRTQVGPNSTIYQSASVFVFIFSAFLLDEALSLRKVASVVFCVAGVAVLTFSKPAGDSGDVKVTVWGYVFLMMSVVFYALYEVCYKYAVEGEEGHQGEEEESAPAKEPLLTSSAAASAPVKSSLNVLHDEEAASTPASVSASAWNDWLLQIEFPMLVSTIIGLGSLLTMWPVFFALNAVPSGPFSEPFELPNHHETMLLVLNAFLDSWYYMLLVFGIAITNPVFMSVGVMLVSPASFVVDYFLHGTRLVPEAWGGVALVIVGFVLLQFRLPVAACERTVTVSTLRARCARK